MANLIQKIKSVMQNKIYPMAWSYLFSPQSQWLSPSQTSFLPDILCVKLNQRWKTPEKHKQGCGCEMQAYITTLIQNVPGHKFEYDNRLWFDSNI